MMPALTAPCSLLVPGQEPAGGVLRLRMSEGVIGKILVCGKKHFESANIRASPRRR
jgi:hemolysin activation/secretion protein